MTAYLLTNHILNFFAPAICIALLLVVLARVFGRFLIPKVAPAYTVYAQTAIIFIVNTVILVAGLILFKNDAKMAIYAAMVLGSAVCQWVMWRGWLN